MPDPSSRLGAAAIVGVPALLLAVTGVFRARQGLATVDLAILDQALWAASRGHGLFTSILGEHLLGDHFEPGMLLFAPLYRLAPTAVWLVVGQAVAAVTGVLLLTGRLRHALSPMRRAVLGAALLASPPLAYAVIFDVHALVFAGPFALAAVFAAEDDRPQRAAVLGLLAAMFRMEAGLGVVVAMLLLRHRGERKTTLALVVVGAYLPLAYLLESHLGTRDSHWAGHFEHLGRTPLDALAHPGRVLVALLSVATLTKVLPWVLTSGLLCLRRPRWILPAAAVALPVVLSEWPGTASWGFHYGYLPTLFLALSWLPRIQDHPAEWRRVVAGCLGLIVLAGPLVPSFAFNVPGTSFSSPSWRGGADRDLQCVVRGIPEGAGVAAVANVLPMLAHRSVLYLWPFPFRSEGTGLLPNPQLQRARPDLAAAVDIVVVWRDGAATVPEGFVLDRSTPTFQRFRRPETVPGRQQVC